MNPPTLSALADFPLQLEAHYAVIPNPFKDWAPASWNGPTTLRGLVHYLCSHDQQHLAGLQWLLGKIEAARLTQA